MKAAATRYAGTPISTRRCTAEAASRVCSVESTRCPVMAASAAMRAVSVSRISPTMMMSGSLRSSVRRMPAKSSPMTDFTSLCITPSSRRSMGSSTV